MPQAIDLTDQFVRDFRLCEGELEELRAAHEQLKAQRQVEKTQVAVDVSRKVLAAQGEIDLLRRELKLAQEELRKQAAPRPCADCEGLRRELEILRNKPASPDSEAIRQSQARLQVQVQTLEKERKNQDLEVAELKKKLKMTEDKCLDLERVIFQTSQGT